MAKITITGGIPEGEWRECRIEVDAVVVGNAMVKETDLTTLSGIRGVTVDLPSLQGQEEE